MKMIKVWTSFTTEELQAIANCFQHKNVGVLPFISLADAMVAILKSYNGRWQSKAHATAFDKLRELWSVHKTVMFTPDV